MAGLIQRQHPIENSGLAIKRGSKMKIWKWVKEKYMRAVREYKYRKRIKELRKQDPFIYK